MLCGVVRATRFAKIAIYCALLRCCGCYLVVQQRFGVESAFFKKDRGVLHRTVYINGRTRNVTSGRYNKVCLSANGVLR